MSRNLRKKVRISYYEPDEPPLDEYVYCENCNALVYEYCSIHGPLLVVPDDKVGKKSSVPSAVPVAAKTIPHIFLHLAPSIIPGAGLGVFSTLTLPRGVRFGPYKGQKSYDPTSDYCWQISDSENRPLHIIDAADANKSNWMRYVNCARHWREQNLVAYQYKGQIYYRTIKIIPRFTELMVFYGSEFAYNLGVDLRQYNSPNGYVQMLLESRKRITKLKDNEQNKVKDERQMRQSQNKNIFAKNEENYRVETFSQTIEIDRNVESKDMTTKENELKHSIIELNELALEITESKGFVPGINDSKMETGDFGTKREENNNLTLKKLICDDCGFKTDQKDVLIQHINSLPFKCSKCPFQTVVHSYLKRHNMLHNETRKFVCDICGLRFLESFHLKRHKKSHFPQNNEKKLIERSKRLHSAAGQTIFSGSHSLRRYDIIELNQFYAETKEPVQR